jgi:hypothetical protein
MDPKIGTGRERFDRTKRYTREAATAPIGSPIK